MLELVTIEEVRAHLRIDDVDSDGGPDAPWLAIFIPAISEAVSVWLKDEWRLYEPLKDSNGVVIEDSSGDPLPTDTVRWVVKAAVLIEIERQYRYRGGESEADVPTENGHGYTLGKGATALLSGLRKSTVA